jgi:hypothetical protein
MFPKQRSNGVTLSVSTQPIRYRSQRLIALSGSEQMSTSPANPLGYAAQHDAN